ncbi:MAG: glucose-1-phosphate cytidylyltransferase [Spirochaetaceae bacterium]|jgi:glucose-1-phosphate cytidylyltransferase|nr:glucose-1-phosphate cytidylyltransferase [Spirochaetaceae bacterium]
MKVVILAGGLGTRLAEETDLRPKPMVEIGGYPILWHIMKIYAYWGFKEFVVLTGYKSHIIKDYFINYFTRYSDITVDMAANTVELHKHRSEDWKVTMLYTGPETMTGGRLLRARECIGGETFMLTYGDGLSDVNIHSLIENHKRSGKPVTLTAVQPSGKFGALAVSQDGAITAFKEKPDGDGAWVNGGFFVMENAIFDYLTEGDSTVLEHSPFEKLSAGCKLNAYKHTGFWRSMDTLKDRNELTALWVYKNAPWALWLKNEGLV